MTLTPDELRVMQEAYGWGNAVIADARVFVTKMDAIIKSNSDITLPRLVMSWPVGDITRRQLAPWFDATGFAVAYGDNKHIHTGRDLNLAEYGDSGAPVFGVADGFIRFAGRVDNAWLSVVITEHTLEDGRSIFVRYAHVNPIPPLVVGSRVIRGELLANIADYGKAGKEGDHLHLDGAWADEVDLANRPGDWPGLDRPRVLRCYFDLVKMIGERLPKTGVMS